MMVVRLLLLVALCFAADESDPGATLTTEQLQSAQGADPLSASEAAALEAEMLAKLIT